MIALAITVSEGFVLGPTAPITPYGNRSYITIPPSPFSTTGSRISGPGVLYKALFNLAILASTVPIPVSSLISLAIFSIYGRNPSLMASITCWRTAIGLSRYIS